MKDLWDKLMVAIPVDKQAAIVTSWTKITDKIKKSENGVDILLVLDLLELSRTISKYNNCAFFLVFKILAQGYDFSSWCELVMGCKDLAHLTNPSTVDELKTTARKLEMDVKNHYGIKLNHGRALDLVAWRFGFDNYAIAQYQMVDGSRRAKQKEGRRRHKQYLKSRRAG